MTEQTSATTESPSNSVYHHGHSSETVKGHSQRTLNNSGKFIMKYLKPGQTVLDVGCGPGSITIGIAERVKPNGKVIGIDQSSEVIKIAEQLFGGEKARNDGLDLSFQIGDIFDLPFDDDSFDLVFAHQVILHLPSHKLVTVFQELKRVLKHDGGVLAIRDSKPDFGGHITFPYDSLISKTITIIMERTYTNGPKPQAAGGFLSIMKEVGFSKIERRFTQDVYQTSEERTIWGEQWSKRCQEDSFRTFALDNGLATEEELDEMPGRWLNWVKNEDAWATMFVIEHECWK